MYGNKYSMFLINPFIYGAPISFENLKSWSGDGVDEYLTGSTITELSNVSAFSTSMWITQPVTGGTDVIFQQKVDATNKIIAIYRGSAATHGVDYIQFEINNGTSSTYIYTGSNVIPSGWNHLAFVFDGSQLNGQRLRIYLNGSLLSIIVVGTIPTTTPTFTTETFDIGGISTGNSINAKMDEVRVYDYALTSGNVTSIYNSGCPKVDDLSTLAVHNYRMGDNDTFPTISDIGTGTTTDLTMTNQESGDITTDTPC